MIDFNAAIVDPDNRIVFSAWHTGRITTEEAQYLIGRDRLEASLKILGPLAGPVLDFYDLRSPLDVVQEQWRDGKSLRAIAFGVIPFVVVIVAVNFFFTGPQLF